MTDEKPITWGNIETEIAGGVVCKKYVSVLSTTTTTIEPEIYSAEVSYELIVTYGYIDSNNITHSVINKSFQWVDVCMGDFNYSTCDIPYFYPDEFLYIVKLSISYPNTTFQIIK